MKKLPWRHPMGSNLECMPKVRPTFDQAVKQVRNRLRRYRTDSIVQCAVSQLHQARHGSRIDELKTWPWLSLLLVKLILEDTTIAMDRGEVCPLEAFRYCLQTLWDAQGSRDRKDDAPGNVYRMIRSVIQGQLFFQGRPSWDFLRWPALIARLPTDHVCHQLFTDRFGVDPRAFMVIIYAAHVPVLTDEILIQPTYFAPLRERYGTGVDRVLDQLSRSTAGLRAELRASRDAAIARGAMSRPHHELNEPPWLKRYPFLQTGSGALAVWHPAVFTRGMEQYVHRRMSESGAEYSQEFGRVFEHYVVEQVDDAGLGYLSEDDYWAVVGKDKHAMEAIISHDDCNVLVDAKLTVYSEDVALSTQHQVVWQSLKQVRNAMNKAWRVCTRLRELGLPDWPCTKSRESFLVVVTSQPVYCATGEHFRRIFKHDIFDPEKLAVRNQSTPTEEQLRLLPLENIVIASIGEWEQLMRCVASGDLDLVAFLREVAAANMVGSTSVMFIGQMLEGRTNEQRSSVLVERARDSCESELIGLIDGHDAIG